MSDMRVKTKILIFFNPDANSTSKTSPLVPPLTECPASQYGPNCQLQCACENDGRCDRMTGCCECEDGFYGQRCEYGQSASLFFPPPHPLKLSFQ